MLFNTVLYLQKLHMHISLAQGCFHYNSSNCGRIHSRDLRTGYVQISNDLTISWEDFIFALPFMSFDKFCLDSSSPAETRISG